MKFLIHFLFILSIIIATADSIPSKSEMEEIIKGDQSNNTGSPDNILKFRAGGELQRTRLTLLWQGVYNSLTSVTIKVFREPETFEYELYIFEILNATNNPTIEDKGIPRVYYHGPILGAYFAIAMTWFDETVAGRFEKEGGEFSETTMLLLFKQATQALKYIHNKNVAHREIDLNSIFIRGQDVFIANFDRSLELCELLEADYEALHSWIWYMVGLPVERRPGSYPLEILISFRLESFKNPIVIDAFKSIMKFRHIRIESTPNAFLPDYERIIRRADAALDQLRSSGTPVQFEWLDESTGYPAAESRRR